MSKGLMRAKSQNVCYCSCRDVLVELLEICGLNFLSPLLSSKMVAMQPTNG